MGEMDDDVLVWEDVARESEKQSSELNLAILYITFRKGVYISLDANQSIELCYS